MNLIYNNREIELDITGHGADIQVSAAYYLDDNKDLTDKELDEVMEKFAEEIDFEAYEQMAGQAEAWGEGDR